VNVNAIHLDRRGGLWVVDTGSPDFGGDPLPGGAKLVRIDLATDRVSRVVPLGSQVALRGSYVDDMRLRAGMAYLTDAGRPGLIVLDLRSGAARRVLDGHPSTMAPEGRAAVLDGEPVRAPDGKVLRVHVDPLELTPDGRWLLYGPLTGPWSRIETRLLDDPAIPPSELALKVEPWANLPPVGGTAMDGNGELYFTDLAENALKRRGTDGRVTTILRDPRLHWVDAPFIDADRNIWLPVAQMDRVALFNGGQSRTRWPVQLFRLPLAPPG
jgi:sugar lactone lactonase YvrE